MIFSWVELELELNLAYIFKGGIGIELKGCGLESEMNWNRLLPELHITAMDMQNMDPALYNTASKGVSQL